jgi:cytochrome c554/c'-like protein
MRLRFRKSQLAPASLAIGILAALAPLRGQEKKPTGDPAAKAPSLTPFYPRSDSCKQCHNHSTRQQDAQLPYVCELTEMQNWAHDRHKLAFTSLRGPRAQQMAKQLGDVTKVAACLNCHSVPKDAEGAWDDGFDRDAEGVTCAACHGAAKPWVAAHHGGYLIQSRKAWRDLPRAARQAEYGLTDLWDPVKRAEVCLSCHLGNASQGKVITHEMYAAGHPPLPSFELATFSRAMPQHWQLMRYKSPESRRGLHATEESIKFEESEMVLAGAIVSLRETMRLLAALTAEKPPVETITVNWPELAQFDCIACHHDLKSSNWRQSADRPGRSGRPALREWATALARSRLSLFGVEHRSAFETRLEAVRRAFDAQPFGRPTEIRSASQSFIELPAVQTMRLDEKTALALLHEICTAARRELPDYDTARQLAWSFKIVFEERFAESERDPRIRVLLNELAKDLALTVGGRGDLERSLPGYFERLYGYDPVRMQAAFAKIKAALPAR